jgi:hypothetical protein
MKDKAFDFFNNMSIQKFNNPMPLPGIRNNDLYNQDPYGGYGFQGNPVVPIQELCYRATLSFSGREDLIENDICINKDYYANVYIQGPTIRELLEKCVEFCNENNIH